MEEQKIEALLNDLINKTGLSPEELLEEIKVVSNPSEVLTEKIVAQVSSMFEQIQNNIGFANSEIGKRRDNGARRTTGIIRLPL